LRGGYQLLEQMEVGFMIDVEEDSPLGNEDYSPLDIQGEETICANTDECKQTREYWEILMERIKSGKNTRY